ncbi:carboxypeptidase-like regulatory domain-containing protein [Aestuariicella sp. G3-2]|nr:carboxypeptidase-like regulatory domain-containing protein [Aestuariicella albida]
MLKKFTVLLSLVFLSANGFGMSIFGAGNACVFSEVSGYLTFNGEPLKGATVTRVSEWQKENTESTVSDENGHFHFDALHQASASKLIPFTEFVASQSISVGVDGESYEIWSNTKRDGDENSELGGKNLKLKCEISDELRLVEDYGTLLVTNCTW